MDYESTVEDAIERINNSRDCLLPSHTLNLLVRFLELERKVDQLERNREPPGDLR